MVIVGLAQVGPRERRGFPVARKLVVLRLVLQSQ